MHFLLKFVTCVSFSLCSMTFCHQMYAYEAKIVAFVDKRAITEKELDDRIRLVLFTSNQSNASDMRNKIRDQVLDAMITEQVKLKAAREGKIEVTAQDLKKAITDIAKQNNMTYEQLKSLFHNNKISIKSLEERIRAQLAWDAIVHYGLPGGGVSEKEIDKALEAENNANDVQFDVSEIVLFTADASKKNETKSRAESILKQVQNGANFNAIAQQLSQSSTASRGGKMGRLSASRMPQNLFNTLQTMKIGEVKMVELDKGFQIIRLNERFSGNRSQQGYIVDFKVAIIPFNEDMSEDDQYAIQAKVDALGLSTSAKQFSKSVTDMGYTLRTVQNFDLDQCPSPQLAAMMKQHKVGDVLKPVRSEEGLQIFFMTKKMEKTYQPLSRGEIKQQLEFQKRNMTAAMLLNKMKARTFICNTLDKTTTAR